MQEKKMFSLYIATIFMFCFTSFCSTNLMGYEDPQGPKVYLIKVPNPNYNPYLSRSDLCYSTPARVDQRQLGNYALSYLSGFAVGGLIGWGTNIFLKYLEKRKHPTLHLPISRLPKDEGEKYDYVVKRENRRKNRRRIAGIVSTVCGLIASVFFGEFLFNSSW